MDLLIWAGVIIFILGGLGLLISAFRTNVFWGLAVIFIPPAALAYLLLHWHDAKGAFKTQLVGLAIIMAVVYSQGNGVSLNSLKASVPGFSMGNTQQAPAPKTRTAPRQSQPVTPAYRCDGRTHCSQMTSCAEAKFFLRNCPGTKMDGDGNGIPCERQWCR